MQFYLVSLGTCACSILRRLLYTSKDVSHSQACPYPHFNSQVYSGNGDFLHAKKGTSRIWTALLRIPIK